MMNFFRNLGFGGGRKPAPAGRSWGAYEAGAAGPESFDQFNPLGDESTGYDPYDPQFGAVGLGVGEEYDPATGTRKKRKGPSGKALLAGVAKLGQPVDITQGMPAATPFRLTGGLLR